MAPAPSAAGKLPGKIRDSIAPTVRLKSRTNKHTHHNEMLTWKNGLIYIYKIKSIRIDRSTGLKNNSEGY